MLIPPTQSRIISLAILDEGQLIGFKALPTTSFNITSPNANRNITDWTALYPQLTFNQAMAYLPNQFERNCRNPHVVSLTAKKQIPVAVYIDPLFVDGSISETVKAERTREALNRLLESHVDVKIKLPRLVSTTVPSDQPLLPYLGNLGIALCVLDAEGLELVLPLSMFNEEWIEIGDLFQFEESEKVPCTIGRVVGMEDVLSQGVMKDWNELCRKLNEMLKARFDHPFRCEEMEKRIGESFMTAVALDL
ncbi:hypothetical protein HDU76_012021 [Blyttiomyces sp. JEL0837]|nr:hypothetical protein HDU76_012021 [Blyttiomyces sp. JEL0837]